MEEVDEIPYIGRKLHKIGTKLWYVRWILNMVFAAIPYTILVLALLGINIFANMLWNDWWAEGNLFLVTQTAYNVIFGIHSIFLMFEW